MHKLTLGALRGAEGNVSSLCLHSQSSPSLRQFLSHIGVPSHYYKVPINPPFIRPPVLIHFFSLLTSLTLSSRPCLIPAIFFLLLSPPPSFRGKCQALSLWRVCEFCRGRGGRPEGGGGQCRDPLLWGLKGEICLNASKALMVTLIGLRQRE